MSGYKYITAFVDLYSGWPEAFAVPDNTVKTVADLIIDQVSCFGSCYYWLQTMEQKMSIS